MRAIRRSIVTASIIGAFLSFNGSSLANTLVIVLGLSDGIVIGADSEISTSQSGPGETACKIHITDKYIWVTAGLLQEDGKAFHVWDEAEVSIKSGGILNEIASRFEVSVTNWLRELLPRFRRASPAEYARMLKGHTAVNAAFLDGANMEILDFKVPDLDAPQNVEIVRRSCPRDCPIGRDFQLLLGNHDAVDAELARSPRFWQTKGIVAGMNYLVDLQHQATPSLVAAPVAILTKDTSGALNWVQKGECK